MTKRYVIYKKMRTDKHGLRKTKSDEKNPTRKLENTTRKVKTTTTTN